MAKKVTDSKVEMTEVLNFHKVPTKLYMDVKGHIYKQLITLLPKRIYTLKKICGKQFWDHLKIAEKRNGGRAFAHMVILGVFPFKFVEHKSPTKSYQLK
jgi:hypothetical protein